MSQVSRCGGEQQMLSECCGGLLDRVVMVNPLCMCCLALLLVGPSAYGASLPFYNPTRACVQRLRW
jgi:hypothetical protein